MWFPIVFIFLFQCFRLLSHRFSAFSMCVSLSDGQASASLWGQTADVGVSVCSPATSGADKVCSVLEALKVADQR